MEYIVQDYKTGELRGPFDSLGGALNHANDAFVGYSIRCRTWETLVELLDKAKSEDARDSISWHMDLLENDNRAAFPRTEP